MGRPLAPTLCAPRKGGQEEEAGLRGAQPRLEKGLLLRGEEGLERDGPVGGNCPAKGEKTVFRVVLHLPCSLWPQDGP